MAAIPTPIWSVLTRRRRTDNAPVGACSVFGSEGWASVTGKLGLSAGGISSLGRGHGRGALAGEDGGKEAHADETGTEDAVGGGD